MQTEAYRAYVSILNQTPKISYREAIRELNKMNLSQGEFREKFSKLHETYELDNPFISYIFEDIGNSLTPEKLEFLLDVYMDNDTSICTHLDEIIWEHIDGLLFTEAIFKKIYFYMKDEGVKLSKDCILKLIYKSKLHGADEAYEYLCVNELKRGMFTEKEMRIINTGTLLDLRKLSKSYLCDMCYDESVSFVYCLKRCDKGHTFHFECCGVRDECPLC